MSKHEHNHDDHSACGHSHELVISTACDDDDCGCGVEREKSELKENYIVIGIATVLLIAGIISDKVFEIGYWSLFFYMPCVIATGLQFMIKAVGNIFKGKVFDENFLMTIATIGAFALTEFAEGCAVMLLYYTGEMLSSLATARSKKSVAETMNLRAENAKRLVDGKLIDTRPQDLKIGDIIVIGTGEKLPADGIILSDTASLNYSMLNGEFLPKTLYKDDEALAGTINEGGAITLQVTTDYADNTVSKILELVQSSQDSKPKAEKFITKFSKYYTPVIVLISAIIAFVVPAFLGYAENFAPMVKVALTFLVISCPCALVISIPLAYFAGIGGASKKGVLVKGGNYLEVLNSIDTVCMDKTGTLTKGVFEVSDYNLAEGVDAKEFLDIITHAESMSNHPIAISVLKYSDIEVEHSRIEDYKEIAGGGISLLLDNKPVLCGKLSLLETNNILVPTSNIANEIGTIIYLSYDNKYMGYVVLKDNLKHDSIQTVKTLKTMGKTVIMMTGDNYETAKAMADELGIEKFYSDMLPQDKAEKVKELQASGKKVLFVGDGLNDAPTLTLADAGMSVGGVGNDASVEASDIVLMTDGTSGIVTAFEAGKKTHVIATENIVLSLVVKLTIMVLSFVLTPMMWLAIVADVGVSIIAILNSSRATRLKEQKTKHTI